MRDDAPESGSDDPVRSTNRAGADTVDSDGPGWKVYAWDLLSSAGIVLLIGALLFTASGIWPPMVAVESGSMQPVLHRGDLVFVMDAHRFPGPNATDGTGVVTAKAARGVGYKKFDGYGDVVVYMPNGDKHRTPVIHRAMFWVEKGEDWTDKANPAYIPGGGSCRGTHGPDIPNCPAPHAGFITKGDHNPSYDQINGVARDGPIKPAWVIGTAEYSVPYLGSIRLNAAAGQSGNRTTNTTISANATAGMNTTAG